MAIAQEIIDQLPPGVPRNTAVTDALELGVTPGEILYARAGGVCLFDYVAHRRDHDHEETMATFHADLEPDCLTPIRDCSRCAAAGLETLEDRLCQRDDDELDHRLNDPPAPEQY
jgi:hypothetical protein